MFLFAGRHLKSQIQFHSLLVQTKRENKVNDSVLISGLPLLFSSLPGFFFSGRKLLNELFTSRKLTWKDKWKKETISITLRISFYASTQTKRKLSTFILWVVPLNASFHRSRRRIKLKFNDVWRRFGSEAEILGVLFASVKRDCEHTEDDAMFCRLWNLDCCFNELSRL